MKNLVTIIIPFYNGNEYLNEAIESVIEEQIVLEIIIVVENGSEAPSLKNKYRNVVIHYKHPDEHKGAGVSRAIGFADAKSRYVAFLDCDDLREAGSLNMQIAWMKEKGLGFSFASFSHFRNSNRSIKNTIQPRAPFTYINFFFFCFTIGCLTVVVDKTFIPNVPRNNFKRRNDYVMWNYVLLYCETNNIDWCGKVCAPVAYHRLHDKSLTNSRITSALYYFKFLRSVNGLNLRSIFYFICYFTHTIGMR